MLNSEQTTCNLARLEMLRSDRPIGLTWSKELDEHRLSCGELLVVVVRQAEDVGGGDRRGDGGQQRCSGKEPHGFVGVLRVLDESAVVLVYYDLRTYMNVCPPIFFSRYRPVEIHDRYM